MIYQYFTFLLSLKAVLAAVDMFLYMPQYENGHWKIASHGNSLWAKIQNRILPLPFMGLAMLPLWANAMICLSIFREWKTLALLLGILAIYSGSFWILCTSDGYKQINPVFKTWSYFTSLFMPSIVGDVNSKFLFQTSMVSVLSHCTLTISVMLIQYNTDWINSKIQPSAYFFLVPFLLCSMVFSWLLQLIANEEFRTSMTSAMFKSPFGMGWNVLNYLIIKNMDGFADILTGISFIW